jgi:hypothetical protein
MVQRQLYFLTPHPMTTLNIFGHCYYGKPVLFAQIAVSATQRKKPIDTAYLLRTCELLKPTTKNSWQEMNPIPWF